MKILFAIQGTGNGHISRARDIYPELIRYGTVDVLISGIQADVSFPYPVKYKLYGMSFIFGKKGGISLGATAARLKLLRLVKDIYALPVEEYDLVINDFEPVSAWACRRKKIPCISLSHQCAVLHPAAPRPDITDRIGELVLRHYAPCTAAYGFHFHSFGTNIFTPVIRKEIRRQQVTDKGHYTVYLPAYDDTVLVKHLSHFESVNWEVFSKHNREPFTFKNITVRPISNEAFIESMASGAGLLCGAGFEGPAEALFLGKKLMVIPMMGQYEQHCNAAGLNRIGVPVILQLSAKYYMEIQQWLFSEQRVKVHYPDMTSEIVARIMKEHAGRDLVQLPEASEMI